MAKHKGSSGNGAGSGGGAAGGPGSSSSRSSNNNKQHSGRPGGKPVAKALPVEPQESDDEAVQEVVAARAPATAQGAAKPQGKRGGAQQGGAKAPQGDKKPQPAQRPGKGKPSGAKRGGDAKAADEDDEDEDDVEEDASEDSTDTESDSSEDDDDDDGVALLLRDGKGNKKVTKRARDSDDEEDSDDGGDDSDASDDSALVDGKLFVDFLFKDPAEIHFMSVKQMLREFVPTDCAAFNTSEIADLVVAQACVGTVITTDAVDDLDAYAVISALNMHTHSGVGSMKALKSLLLKHVDADHKSELDTVLNGKKTGLLINERLINMPYTVAPRLFQCLLEDIAWSRQNLDAQAARDMFAFDKYVIVCHCFEDDEDTSAAGDSRKKVTTGDTGADKRKRHAEKKLYYYRFEEGLLEEAASIVFSFPLVVKHTTSGEEIRVFKKVLVFPAAKLPAIVKKMEQQYGE